MKKNENKECICKCSELLQKIHTDSIPNYPVETYRDFKKWRNALEPVIIEAIEKAEEIGFLSTEHEGYLIACSATLNGKIFLSFCLFEELTKKEIEEAGKTLDKKILISAFKKKLEKIEKWFR